LIGETFKPDSAANEASLFYKRSPINFVGNLRSPMIVFQGLRDKIVPPSVAREMVAVLKEQGIKYQYIEYEDEAHGFKQIENNVDAWTRELAFYREVLLK
jgi:dipeptidyl aminopeptidase/acylaminoacyl peptidase